VTEHSSLLLQLKLELKFLLCLFAWSCLAREASLFQIPPGWKKKWHNSMDLKILIAQKGGNFCFASGLEAFASRRKRARVGKRRLLQSLFLASSLPNQSPAVEACSMAPNGRERLAASSKASGVSLRNSLNIPSFFHFDLIRLIPQLCHNGSSLTKPTSSVNCNSSNIPVCRQSSIINQVLPRASIRADSSGISATRLGG
jgi:hypothetical protein